METTVKATDTVDTQWRTGPRPVVASVEDRFDLGGFLLESGKKVWSWLHLLSLDAPLVAVLWQLLFAKALRVHLAPVVTLILASVIWLIYVGDRILDSYQSESIPGEALRHRFYREHRAAFLPALLAVLLATGWMAYVDLGLRVQCAGLLLAVIVGGYFAVVHLTGNGAVRWFPKEMIVAVVFGIGTFMPVSLCTDLHLRFLLPFALFLLVLWMNTLFIEYCEWVKLRACDADRPHESTILVGRHMAAFGALVGILALCAMVSRWFPSSRPILFAEGLSALGFGVLGWQWRRISSYTLRVTADVVLLTPLLLLVRR